jgi:hypothetical protein
MYKLKCPYCKILLGNYLYADACPHCRHELEHNTRIVESPQTANIETAWPVLLLLRLARFVER